MSGAFVLIGEARLTLTYERHVEILEALASRTGIGASVG